ncbi:NAD(P)-binding domain-containing protein [Streptomyces sp. NRRL B-1347]|uniref:NAD(P)-binding domain-containing protein n=1 Tax=Streptomyces sp. NRRL B-1347 TaxID=1476877 RepID=UPI000ADA1B32|nr:NAD(P)-binding domain-containing protein [Streptomyces sp. NRRL B-1347]
MPNGGLIDYLIVGAGPAGLQAGYFLDRSGHSYLIVESGTAPGTFFTRFPRHRKLISINKVHTGWDDPELRLRTDWNSLLSYEGAPLFTERTPRYFPAADDMVRYLADFAATHRLNVRYGTRVTGISRPGPPAGTGDFTVRTADGTVLRARRLIMATGVSLPYVPPDIEGVETAERYDDVSVDPDDFTGERVLIIGRGNSGFETADNLIETAAVIHLAGPGSLRMAWQTHFVGHLRAVNNNFLDTYQLKSQNALLDGRVLAVRKQPDGTYVAAVSFARVDEVVKEIPYDRVILATGFRFDASLFAPECRPRLTINDRFPAQTDAWESVDVPDLFFAGTLTQVRDFKKSTSGFIHGFRYGVRALHRILERRYHGVPWPGRDLPATAAAAADAVIARVNRSSALWQQFGVMADALLLGTDGGLRHCEEVPVDHLHRAVAQGHFGDVTRYFGVTLEYGADHDRVDPFDIGVGRVGQRDTSGLDGRYLHPVVRAYRAGELLAEHHLTENLENEWDSEEVHRAPLLAFLREHLAPDSAGRA